MKNLHECLNRVYYLMETRCRYCRPTARSFSWTPASFSEPRCWENWCERFQSLRDQSSIQLPPACWRQRQFDSLVGPCRMGDTFKVNKARNCQYGQWCLSSHVHPGAFQRIRDLYETNYPIVCLDLLMVYIRYLPNRSVQSKWFKKKH